MCLSSGGLKRHSSSKHSTSPALSSSSTADGSLASSSSRKGKKVEDILHPGIFKKMVQISLLKLSKDECYPGTVLDQFSHFVIGSVEDIFPCYHKISDSIIKFNGNSEKFLSTFYAAVSLNDVFPLLSNECKLLLGFEVANHVLAYLAGGKVQNEVVVFEEKRFDERQQSIISYVSGYVVGKFYRKLRFSKKIPRTISFNH